MNVGQVIADGLKREGVDLLFTYPLNPLTVLHALVRGIRKTQEGTPVLLEFITMREKRFSTS